MNTGIGQFKFMTFEIKQKLNTVHFRCALCTAHNIHNIMFNMNERRQIYSVSSTLTQNMFDFIGTTVAISMKSFEKYSSTYVWNLGMIITSVKNGFIPKLSNYFSSVKYQCSRSFANQIVQIFTTFTHAVYALILLELYLSTSVFINTISPPSKS